MNWPEISQTVGKFAPLLGTVLAGAPGAAMGALVASALGVENTPGAVAQAIQSDPNAALKLKQLELENEKDLRAHAFKMIDIQLKDAQESHNQTQETIRAGDTALDKAVRMVRPNMAKQSWVATIAYCLCSTVVSAFDVDIWSIEVAAILAGPAYGYLGLRQIGKGLDSIMTKKASA